jgi:hypothetical protein
MNPLFLSEILEPLVIITKQASRVGTPLVWANQAFFRLGGWAPSSTTMEQVFEAGELRQLRNAAEGPLLGQPRQLEMRYRFPLSSQLNVAFKRLWLYLHPLLPPHTGLGDITSDSSSCRTVFCTCSWMPSLDFRTQEYPTLAFTFFIICAPGLHIPPSDLASSTCVR